jgi:hypothetical protein
MAQIAPPFHIDSHRKPMPHQRVDEEPARHRQTAGSLTPPTSSPPRLSAAPPVDLRADLQRFAARLEQRLATACRPAEPMVFLAGLPETRFVYLDGIGAIFLLPPRSLPPQASVKSDQAKPEISVSGAPTGPQVLVTSDERPSDLTDLEARIRETRKEAERMRAQAEAAFAETGAPLMAELRPDFSDSAPRTPLPDVLPRGRGGRHRAWWRRTPRCHHHIPRLHRACALQLRRSRLGSWSRASTCSGWARYRHRAQKADSTRYGGNTRRAAGGCKRRPIKSL